MLVLAGLVVLLMLLLIAAAMLIESPWARDMLEDQASQRLGGRDVQIGELDIDWGLPLGIRLSDLRIANTDWAEHEQIVQMAGLEVTVDVGQLVQGNIGLERVAMAQPVVHLARREDGTSNWAGLTPDEAEDVKKADEALGFQPDVITIDRGRITYQDAKLDVAMSADIQTTDDGQDGRHLQVQAQGQFRGNPLQLSARGGAPSRIFTEETYPVALEGNLGDMQLGFDGQVRDVLQFQALQGQVSATLPEGGEMPAPLGQSPASVPALDLQAQLNHEGQRWALKNIEMRSGESHLTGLMVFEPGDTPRFEIQLHANQLDLNRLGVMGLLDPEEGEEREAENPSEKRPEDAQHESFQKRLAQRLNPLQRYQGQVDISIGRLLYGDEVLREVVLQGELERGHLDMQQIHAVQGDGKLAAQGWLDVQGDTLKVSLDAELDQVDLGQALAPLGYSELGVLEGQIHTRFSDGALKLSNTEVDYRAPAQGLALHVQAETREREEAQPPGVHVEGSARWRETPFRFDLDLGPLLSLTDAETPYPVQGTVTSRDTTLYADGTVTQPLAPEAVDAQLRLEGPNPAQLNALLGQDLPDMAAYEISGRLRWHDSLLRLTDIQAELGDSDIQGDIRFKWDGRTTLWATLRSQQMNERDVEPLWESEDEESKSFFSDEPFNLEALRRLDIVVDYRADNLNARNIPLSDVQTEVELRQGVLTVDPLQLGVGSGEVTMHARLDAREAPLQGRWDMSAARVNLTPLLKKADLPEIADATDPAESSAGVIGGKGQVRFRGRSMDALMASLDGKLELAISRGYLDAVILELLGLDAGEALVAALADSERVPMQCGYVRLDADDGLVALEQFYVNTQDANYTAGGTIDLGAEHLNLTFKAHPKDVSLLSFNTPVQLQGPLRAPEVSVISAELLARGAASVVGALVAPPLAILPWVEPGTGEGVGPGCRQALSEFETDANQE
ncbi:hypothetical protein GCM10027040_19860 [Halomonas shantousis]